MSMKVMLTQTLYLKFLISLLNKLRQYVADLFFNCMYVCVGVWLCVLKAERSLLINIIMHLLIDLSVNIGTISKIINCL